jgi:hypothetical protein
MQAYNTPMDFCPICRGAEFAFKAVSDSYEIQCDTCGHYKASSTFVATGFDDPELLPALQAFLKHENSEGLLPELTTSNWKVFAERYH